MPEFIVNPSSTSVTANAGDEAIRRLVVAKLQAAGVPVSPSQSDERLLAAYNEVVCEPARRELEKAEFVLAVHEAAARGALALNAGTSRRNEIAGYDLNAVNAAEHT